MKGKSDLIKTYLNHSFVKDFSWYALGSFFPMLLGFVKTPVFTRHFSTHDFGQLGLVSIGFNFLGILFFSWIGSCIWRYFQKYQLQKKLGSLYSNLLLLYFFSAIILAGVTLILYKQSSGPLQKSLILFSFFQVMLNQLLVCYTILLRLNSRSREHTFFQILRAFFSLSISLLLVFYCKMNISALIFALVITDSVFIAYLILKNPIKIRFQVELIDQDLLRSLLRYGSMGLVLNFSLLAINYSDRYAIALFYDLNAVGIYDQIYKISQLSVMAMVMIYFNTINPYLLNKLETEFELTIPLIRKYLFAYLAVGIPLIFYLSLFSKEIAFLLLGSEFRSDYAMMPMVFLASFLYGISNLLELRLKFKNRLLKLSLITVGSLMLNITLNLILIPSYGYQWAAFSTVLTYVGMIGILHFYNPGILKVISRHWKFWLRMILLLTVQFFGYLFLIRIIPTGPGLKMIIGVIFVLIFIGVYFKRIAKLDLPVK